MNRIWFVGLLIALLFSFNKENDQLEPYQFDLPKGFLPLPENDSNPVSIEGASLGRFLFYDPILSADSTISCSSCHKQEFAFSDGGKKLSIGIDGHITERNTPGLFNLAWNERLFFDGRAKSIEDQAFFPVKDHNEMNLDWDEAITRLGRSTFYSAKFKEVFGESKLDSTLVTKALGQFERTLISGNSKIDRVVKGQEKLSALEVRGHEIMNDQTLGNCLHCHTTDANLMGTTYKFSNNGLDPIKKIEKFKDPGLGAITRSSSDYGKFKIPSIRNIELTGPYMHDGRFNTLEEVVSFYSDGINNCVNIDNKIKGRDDGGAHLSADDQQALVAFLKCFTDTTFTQSNLFSNPF